MKKVIYSCFLIFILSVVTSCKINDAFYIIKYDYNIINDDFVVEVLSKKYNSPYMKNEHIINAWLFDNINGDRIPVKIINIKQEKINKYYKYKIFIDNTLYHDSEILMFNANLKIEYINNKILDIPLGNVNLIKITEDYDLKILKMLLEEEGVEKTLILNIKNEQLENIKVLNIRLINGYFKADMTNYGDLIIKKQEEVMLKLPLFTQKNLDKYETAIIIEYEMNHEKRYKVIKNFCFLQKTSDSKVEINVTN